MVVDPIVRSSSGAELLTPDGLAVLRQRILPLASVVTPNLDEAAILTGVAAATSRKRGGQASCYWQPGCKPWSSPADTCPSQPTP